MTPFLYSYWTFLWPPDYLNHTPPCSLNIQLLYILAARSPTNWRYWRRLTWSFRTESYHFPGTLEKVASFLLIGKARDIQRQSLKSTRSSLPFNSTNAMQGKQPPPLHSSSFAFQNKPNNFLTLLPMAMIRCFGSSGLPKQWGHFSIRAASCWCSRIAWFLCLASSAPLCSPFAAFETNMSSRV